MKSPSPKVVLLAGPNGAGKSTTAAQLLRGTLGVGEFVNADVIARGLSSFNTDEVSMAAGRVMLARLHELAAAERSFAFETTLASRSFAPWIGALKERGYAFLLVFLWLPHAEGAAARVAERVCMGGHSVSPETIRRRFDRGLTNFFGLYRPLATRWWMYDNSVASGPRLIAAGRGLKAGRVADAAIWTGLEREYLRAE